VGPYSRAFGLGHNVFTHVHRSRLTVKLKVKLLRPPTCTGVFRNLKEGHTISFSQFKGGMAQVAPMVNTPTTLPVFRLGSTISLSPVLEPVRHLCRRQPSRLGQLPLLPRRRVRVVSVPVSQHRPRLLLETVRRLLAVPDSARQREFTPDAVFPDGAERSSAQFFRLDVVTFEPERLEFGMVVRREVVRFQQTVEFFEVAAMERHDCPRIRMPPSNHISEHLNLNLHPEINNSFAKQHKFKFSI